VYTKSLFTSQLKAQLKSDGFSQRLNLAILSDRQPQRAFHMVLDTLILVHLGGTTSSLFFVVRVRCRRKESSRSLSHLLVSFLFSSLLID